jgi:hypothetical protein
MSTEIVVDNSLHNIGPRKIAIFPLSIGNCFPISKLKRDTDPVQAETNSTGQFKAAIPASYHNNRK